MKINNPFSKTAVQVKAETHAPAVSTWLQANAGNKVVTLNELRAGLPAIAADLSRPVVNAICQAIGAEVIDPEDTQA